MTNMASLLERLEKAKFTGHLDLHFDRGQIVRAELRHWLANSEFTEPLPTVESESPPVKPTIQSEA
jgi:hypothetical protein